MTVYNTLQQLISDNRIEIYLVGGYVRDRLLSRECKDHDFVVVGATPDIMLNVGFKQVGADFPVFLAPNGDEYALARTERKVGQGYNGFQVYYAPDVSLKDDLYRRDLTINAMARKVIGWNEDGHAELDDEVIDYFGGQDDLANKTIRHVSEAFSEDPLRTLRVARFAARYNFDVDPSTVQLMKDIGESGEYRYLTSERVWVETEKALGETNYFIYFKILNDVGYIQDILSPHYEFNNFEMAYTSWTPDRKQLFRECALPVKCVLVGFDMDVTGVLKVPKDVKRFAYSMHGLLPNIWQKNAVWILDTFNNIGVFRSDKVLNWVKQYFTFHGMSSYLNYLEVAVDITHKSLKDEGYMDGVEGSQISEVIDHHRRLAIQTLIVI